MKIISYLRVSTKHQGSDGLGIDAQRATVASYCENNDGTLVSEFVEVESGRKSNRTQLLKAIEECKNQGCTLAVAKLDRLSRSVSFTSALLDSGLPFICLDNLHANEFTIKLLALLAEDEARKTSKRTREALARIKAKGGTLGGPSTRVAGLLGNAANTQAAKEHAESVKPIAARKRSQGWTLEQIAHYLTAKGHLTRRGGAWSASTVMRLLAA